MTRSRITLAILLVSISINLFLIAGIAMRVSNVRDSGQARPFPPNIGWIIRDLSEARQSELLEIMQPFAEQISPLRRDMMDAQRQVNNLMAAPDYDEETLNTALSELRAAASAYTTLSHEQTIRLMGQLTEEERRAATDFVQRRGPRDGRNSFRGPGGPGGSGRRGPPGPGFPPPEAPGQ